ncbi:MAG: hypothetical protein LV480_13670 [Methylacidiphilales bacterium]|nr:hypothetical protein [Candidatus Methylacidiphilales bacterium]
MLKGISFKAILIGIVSFIAIEVVTGFFLGIAIVIFISKTHASHAHSYYETINRLNHSLSMMLIMLGLGVGSGVLSGAATGWIAPANRIKNAFVMYLVLIVLSQPLSLIVGDYPLWFDLVGLVSGIASAMLGGWIVQLIYDDRKPEKSH